MLLGILPAQAQSAENCALVFNEIEIDRIDSLSSPLELDTGDTLSFTGTDPAGTRSARVELAIGPVTLESNTTTYSAPEREFQSAISLDDVSPYGIGLFRAEGATDGCSAAVWVRISGRFPLATLTGLTAMGLTLGGITGQLGAIASRRRWARTAAALGGIATGSGLTLIGQQFGRLQVSYPSLAAMTIAVGGLGLILASLFNPTIRDRRREKRAVRSPAISMTPDHQPVETVTSAVAEEPPAEPRTANGPTLQPTPPGGPYWCYVMAPTDAFDLTDHTRTVAVLEPGTWYLVKRALGGWAQVVAAEGSEGWVAEAAIHREG